MKKVISPCLCEVGGAVKARAFCKIEFSADGRLSISGVIGPMRSGNCKGSAGQCVEEIRAGEPTDGWTAEMLQKFCDIWDEWHLNDMRPYCQHQKELGWDKLAGKEVTLYNYTLSTEASKKKRAAENAALAALKKGETFAPTEEQVKYAALPYSITTHEELSGNALNDYQPKKPLSDTDGHFTQKKTLGWLHPSEHPDGILGRPCPVCGYQYGHEWKKEEVPQEVIDWLFNLPTTTITPAWV